MSDLRVAFVGTGSPSVSFPEGGFAMAYVHADAYRRLEDTRLVGCADIVRENAERFADEYDVDGDGVFEDYEAMLDAVEPDVVSICTPPATHADIVEGCADSGAVEAIHCEKPMALTWEGSQRMTDACERNDVQLTFNHMRRFSDPARDAKARLDDGVIGDLERIEYSWGDFYDNGTHAIDLCNYFNDEHAARWVIGQLDYREEDVRFGAHQENQMFASWEYDNDVYGVAATGPGGGMIGADFRLVGEDGVVEVDVDEEPVLRVRRADGETETVTYEGRAEGEESCHDRAIETAVRALRGDGPPELRAENALNATEIIFGGYESVRRRGRVDLPLAIDDNPLEEMVASGILSPQSAAGD